MTTSSTARWLRRRLEKIVTEDDVAEAKYEIEAWWAARQRRLSELPWSDPKPNGHISINERPDSENKAYQ